MFGTWRELINSAHSEINVLRGGGAAVVEPLLESRSFQRLKSLLNEWNLDELLRHGETSVRYTATAVGKDVITIGKDTTPASDINIVSPDRIQAIRYQRWRSTFPFNLMPIGLSRWSEAHSMNNVSPTLYYYDMSHPVAKLRLNGGMLSGDYFDMFVKERFDIDAALVTDSFDLPDGYDRAIMMNLAVELAPSLGVSEINPLTYKAAMHGLTLIRQRNTDFVRTEFRDLVDVSGGVNGRYRGRGYGS